MKVYFLYVIRVSLCHNLYFVYLSVTHTNYFHASFSPTLKELFSVVSNFHQLNTMESQKLENKEGLFMTHYMVVVGSSQMTRNKLNWDI